MLADLGEELLTGLLVELLVLEQLDALGGITARAMFTGTAKPMGQLPSPIAEAASIRFSAASAQSSTIHGPCAMAEIRISNGA